MKNYRLLNINNQHEAMKELEQSEVVSYDTETTGLNVRQSTVIGFSFSCKQGAAWYLPIYVWKNEQLERIHNEVTVLLFLNKLKAKQLIMHNGSFDIRVTLNNLSVNLLNSLHADTQLMKHTINEEGPFALKDNAIEYASEIGFEESDVANQEQLDLKTNVLSKGGSWTKENKEMYKADLEILYPYACADADLTLRLFVLFSAKLKQENLEDFFYNQEVMPLYKSTTIKMEHRGLYLFLQKLIEFKNQIAKDIDKLKLEILEKIEASPEGNTFLLRRLEEIEIKTIGKFAQAICKELNLPLPLSESGKYTLNKKEILKLAESNIKEFFLTKNPELLPPPFVYKIRKTILLEEQGGTFLNISSKHQLGELVFDIMGIKPLTTTEKGAPQFNEALVETLATKYNIPWAEKLRVYNKLLKIKGSYYDRFYDQQEGGVFFPHFGQHKTTSGRYGSDIQQLSRPIEEGSDDDRIVTYTNSLRELFIPKPGYIFIDNDYEALEPRCFAHDSGDMSLMEIFIRGEDLYSKIALMALGLTDCSADKKAANYLKNKYPKHRQDAKAYSLGIRYGAKAGKVAALLNVDKEEAQELINNYFKAFPNLKKRMQECLIQAKTTGKVSSEFGRIRHLPRLKEIYDQFGDAILDYKNLKKLSIQHYIPFQTLSQIRKEYNALSNNALNFPIQAMATSIVNRAAIAMSKQFMELNLDAWVSAQIHDELIISCKEEIAEQVASIVQECMENTNKLSMPLVAKPEIARNFREGKS